MDGYEPEGADEERYLACSHLLVCHTLWYDNANADAGFSLGRVVVHLRPDPGNGFPLRVRRLFLYAQLHGTSGDYLFRARFVRLDADGDEAEELRVFGPWERQVPGENYLECFGFQLDNVFLPEPGVYEFQLWADEFDEVVGRERIEARE